MSHDSQSSHDSQPNRSAEATQLSDLTNRREFCQWAALATGAAALAQPATAATAADLADEAARVISQLPHRYHGWPTVAKAPDGELLVVCSGGRESHVCPFGRVELMRSRDGGRNWTFPRTLLDGPIDDRDAGVLITSKGTILVTTFTSLAYERSLAKLRSEPDSPRKQAWLGAHARLDEQGRRDALGVWMIRSEDGGQTFSPPYRTQVNSPHGPVELRDGRLLYAGKRLWDGSGQVGVCVSKDDGQTWSWLANIPTRDGDDHNEYHELHAVEASNGDLIAQIRNHNKPNAGETLQSRSTDGGKTWSTPASIGVWGLPSHLLRLQDGRLLMSYGYRRKPYGNQARLSEDDGQTWSEPITISADGIGGDLGYPSTVQLSERELLTVWYERMADSPRSVLRQRRWQLPS
ncbi:MAG: exo-alpha-sialidase [Planctomycetales bacterium]|nr:exo-alpha-sialidase [Planctomycetales bacterium]